MVSEEKSKMWKVNDGWTDRRTDDGQRVITIVHLSLRLRCTKNVSANKRPGSHLCWLISRKKPQTWWRTLSTSFVNSVQWLYMMQVRMNGICIMYVCHMKAFISNGSKVIIKVKTHKTHSNKSGTCSKTNRYIIYIHALVLLIPDLWSESIRQYMYCKTLIIRVILFSRGHHPRFIHETLYSRLVISSSIILTKGIIGDDFIFTSLLSREFTRK